MPGKCIILLKMRISGKSSKTLQPAELSLADSQQAFHYNLNYLYLCVVNIYTCTLDSVNILVDCFMSVIFCLLNYFQSFSIILNHR